MITHIWLIAIQPRQTGYQYSGKRNTIYTETTHEKISFKNTSTLHYSKRLENFKIRLLLMNRPINLQYDHETKQN